MENSLAPSPFNLCQECGPDLYILDFFVSSNTGVSAALYVFHMYMYESSSPSGWHNSRGDLQTGLNPEFYPQSAYVEIFHLNAVNQAWPHFHSLRPQKSSKIEGTNLSKNVQTRFAGLYNLCHPGLYKVHILFLCFKLLAPPSQYQIEARYSHCDIRVATTCISDAVFLQKMYIIWAPMWKKNSCWHQYLICIACLQRINMYVLLFSPV